MSHPMRCDLQIQSAQSALAKYGAIASQDGRAIAFPECSAAFAAIEPIRASAEDQGSLPSALGALMVASTKVEPVLGLLCGTRQWRYGRQQRHDFLNVWNLSRYAGIQSRFSPHTAQQHLQWAERWPCETGNDFRDPAPFIIRGNALRQLHRYSEAECAYLHGLDVNPGDPFLKFRLVDLWLMTHQHGRANELLASLCSRYPDALEMLFALPVPDTAIVPDKIMPELDADGADFVWLVAADPVYLQRYGQRLAQGIARQMGETLVKLHVHVVTEPDKPAPTDVLEAMATLIPLHVTQRQLDLGGASADQRKALFASERFLFLAEMLTKYQKPMLVSDIDVECLQNPHALFNKLGDADIGHTRFGTVRDAWDRYPATVLLFQPTPAAIAFCQRLSGMIITLLNNHPNPWFVDQVALFRLIEGGLTPAKLAYLEYILTSSESPVAYFRILHGSWQPADPAAVAEREAKYQLGSELLEAGDPAQARTRLREAQDLGLATPALHNLLGAASQQLGELDAAEASYRAAIAQANRRVPAFELNLGMLCLLRGNYPEGWQRYEARLETQQWQEKEAFAGTRWQGEPLANRRLLVWAEQGFGDAIQFVRFLPGLRALNPAATIVLACPVPLHRLLASHLDASAVSMVAMEDVPEFDLTCPLLSLPQRLGVTLADLSGSPYLQPNPAHAAQMLPQLQALPGPRLGLVWSGNATWHIDYRRSVPAGALQPLFNIPGINWVSLQLGGAARQAQDFPIPCLQPLDPLADFATTALLMAHLDLLISVDTAAVHLAGALGCPAWLINRFDSDWRWQATGDTSPWYDSVRIFRQPRRGDWAGAVGAVAAALAGKALPE